MKATPEDLLQRVDGIAARLEANAADGERRGALADDSIAAFREAKLLALKIPVELGGEGANPVVETAVLEAAAAADGSSGWVLGILTATAGIAAAFLPDAGVEMIFQGDETTVAGALAPRGRATPCEGGYRLSGHWSFGSGIHHADWVLGGAAVEGQAPPAGLRILGMPRDAVNIHDNWQVAGLRGTGSCDYSVDDVFVPEALSISFIDTVRGQVARGGAPFAVGMPAAVAPFHTGIALGIAKRALAEISAQAAEKVRGVFPSPLVENPGFQERLGRVALELDAARELAFAAIGEVWACAESGALPPPALQARARATSVYVTEVAQRVATTAFHAAGGGALFDATATALLSRRPRGGSTLSGERVVVSRLRASPTRRGQRQPDALSGRTPVPAWFQSRYAGRYRCRRTPGTVHWRGS